jgi:imidazolonepropionase
VCAGSDSGFIFQVYGFGLIRELELLQEAGFNPLEVLRSATSLTAELLGVDEHTGSIDVGKRADLLVLDHNPLDDFKLLYATGAWRLNDETGRPQWNRALAQTICSGTVYQVDELLDDVRSLVDRSWEGHADERPPGP